MPSILSIYLTLNLLIAIAFVCVRLVRRFLQLPAQTELRLNYRVAVLVLLVTGASVFLPGNSLLSPAVRVWAAPSLHAFPHEYSESQPGFVRIERAPAVRSDRLASVWILVASAVALGALLRLSRDLRYLVRLRRNAFLIRRIGQLRIYVHDHVPVPFSYRGLCTANVIVPSRLVFRHQDFKMVVAHELQHHRQRDTSWQYLLWVLRLVCFGHPLLAFWLSQISELQEFACDEVLAGRKFPSHAYARCLLEVAQQAIGPFRSPVGATGMAFLTENHLLKRRIERMAKPINPRTGRTFAVAIIAMTATLLAGAAYASKGLVQDRRISLAEAQALAKNVDSETGFPVVINQHVVAQLNRMVGTPEGRDFIRASLQRMESYRPMIEKKLAQYRAPNELMAIPLIESGYQNLDQCCNKVHSAGLWQFIPETARVYGLRVDNQVDQRLDAEALTDVAMRYLVSNDLRFKDWQLAILAYNIGERRTQEGIVKTGSRDAWELVRAGYENDMEYLARFMAGLVILKNPSLVR